MAAPIILRYRPDANRRPTTKDSNKRTLLAGDQDRRRRCPRQDVPLDLPRGGVDRNRVARPPQDALERTTQPPPVEDFRFIPSRPSDDHYGVGAQSPPARRKLPSHSPIARRRRLHWLDSLGHEVSRNPRPALDGVQSNDGSRLRGTEARRLGPRPECQAVASWQDRGVGFRGR